MWYELDATPPSSLTYYTKKDSTSSSAPFVWMYSDGCSCCCCCRRETSERLNRDLLVSNNCTEEYPALIIISCFRLPLLFLFIFMRLNLAPLLPLDSLIDQSTLSSALDSYSHRHSLDEMMLLWSANRPSNGSHSYSEEMTGADCWMRALANDIRNDLWSWK